MEESNNDLYFSFYSIYTVRIFKLRACANFNNNVLSINQKKEKKTQKNKKMARNNTTPKHVLFKLSGDKNVSDSWRMAKFEYHKKGHCRLLFSKVR